jgi:hypothetical protein
VQCNFGHGNIGDATAWATLPARNLQWGNVADASVTRCALRPARNEAPVHITAVRFVMFTSLKVIGRIMQILQLHGGNGTVSKPASSTCGITAEQLILSWKV